MILDENNFEEIENALLLAVLKDDDFLEALIIIKQLNELQVAVMLCQVSGVLSSDRWHKLADAAKVLMNDGQDEINWSE